MSLREAAQAALVWMERADWMTFGAFFKDGQKIQEALRAALAEAESAGAEPVAWTTDYEIEVLRDGFVQQLTGRSVRLEPLFPAHQVKYLYTHPPAREAESVVNQQLTTELSDSQILSIASRHRIYGGQELDIVPFARAVLAARGKG